VSPDNGSELHASSGLVTFEFTRNIRFQQCVLIIGGSEKEIAAYPNGKFVTVEVKEELIAAYRNNTLKVGDDILVQLRGVASEDGKTQLNDITVKYKAAPEPLMLESAMQIPGNGLEAISSWMSTKNSEGLVVLTFNGNVSSTANITAELSYGDIEAEDPNEYYVEAKLEGDGKNGIMINATVENKGKLKGSEVVQVYVKSFVEGAPNLSLKAFKRVELNPGEKRSVEISLSPKDLSLYNENGELTLNPGKYEIYVGNRQPDSRSDKLLPTKISKYTFEI
jgi:hypothetical protein